MVFVMGGWWPHSCCFGGCCFQELFNIARSILVQLLSSFFSIRFVSLHVVLPYSRNIAVLAFASHILMSFSVDETLIPREVNLSTSFRDPPLSAEISPFWLKTCTPFCVHSHGGQCHQLLAPDSAASIRLG